MSRLLGLVALVVVPVAFVLFAVAVVAVVWLLARRRVRSKRGGVDFDAEGHPVSRKRWAGRMRFDRRRHHRLLLMDAHEGDSARGGKGDKGVARG